MDASSLLKWLSSFLGWLWSMLIWPIWTGDDKMAKYLQIPRAQLESGECVGEGGFGQVFRGKWKTKEGEKTVAMKRVTKFEKEVKILSEFDHPNVIQFYGVSEDHLGYIIVTEYAEGGSLYDHLHNGNNTSIDFKQIITWALEIARGVEYLHYDAPVKTIHRDLKSKNVVLTSERVCKLCDFGASKNSVHSVTSTSLNGTIPWMSPEQIKRDRISTATDVWSYGVILWEMITRKMPYKGLPELTVFGSIANNGSTLVIPEDCPAAFKRLMQNCWIMEPENRYNMRQVISALNDMQMEMQPETMLRNELQKMRDELQKTMRDELRKTREEMKQMIINESTKTHTELQKMRDELQEIRHQMNNQNLFGAIALMRTLGECVSDEDLTRALRLTGNDPSMVLVYDAIKCRKRALAKGVTDFIRVFGYPRNNPDVWICVIEYVPYSFSPPSIYFWPNATENVTYGTLEDALKQFNECYRIRGSLFCPHKIADKVIEICDWLTEGVKMWNWFNKFYLFYMGRKQQKKVCKKNAELPSEYCFDDVRPDSDGRNEWERIRYKCYPSVAVRRGNRLMGIGYLRFRSEYVYHEHSSIPQEDESSVKSALKTRFYQKCISEQICPFNLIHVDDEDALNEYNKSDLWTRFEDGDGIPIVVNDISC